MSEASPQIAARNEAVRMELPFDDDQDFEDARRGRVGSLSDPVIRSTSGRIAWDADAYDFLDGECPPTVNPSLWRQSRLNAIHGLFEVAEGIYQVRGLDLSNMTIVEGDEGVLVIDPLISCETAAAALALYRAHRGERPVTGLLYTHSHVDHFGGARGVIAARGDLAGPPSPVPIIAPEGLPRPRGRRERLRGYGDDPARHLHVRRPAGKGGPPAGVGAGLGQTTSLGTVSLVPPTIEITHTGQELTVDGIRMEFQMTPGTEAPAEMNFLFADRGALCMAENATHNLHNVLTLRGALVRDARVWAAYLDEAIELFSERADVVFAQHHWPRWGRERIVDFLSKQRDLYAYVHDQTLRLLNKGLVASEIAETLELPPGLAREWHCRGYYGSLSHNAKAVYQRYLGWFDGNPAHLWPHPPQAAAERYVALAGGAEPLLAHARRAFEEGDLRWVVEVVNHLVFADPGQRGGQGAAGARARAARLRRRERDLAQLLPDGGQRAARRGRGNGQRRAAGHAEGARDQADPRCARGPARRPPRGRGRPHDAPEPARHRRAVQAHALERRADAPARAAGGRGRSRGDDHSRGARRTPHRGGHTRQRWPPPAA